jgi:hypothetical protein
VELRDRRTFADDIHAKRTPNFSLALDAVHPFLDALFVILIPTLMKLEAGVCIVEVETADGADVLWFAGRLAIDVVFSFHSLWRLRIRLGCMEGVIEAGTLCSLSVQTRKAG